MRVLSRHLLGAAFDLRFNNWLSNVHYAEGRGMYVYIMEVCMLAVSNGENTRNVRWDAVTVLPAAQ